MQLWQWVILWQTPGFIICLTKPQPEPEQHTGNLHPLLNSCLFSLDRTTMLSSWPSGLKSCGLSGQLHLQYHSLIPCSSCSLGFKDAKVFCKVALESRIRAEVRKRSEKKVTGRTTPEVLIWSKNLLSMQCYKVAESFRKTIAKSPFNILSLQLGDQQFKWERIFAPCSGFVSEWSSGTVPQAGGCSQEFWQFWHRASITSSTL